MSPLRMAYLALALWGAVHPMWYYAQWISENGPDLPKLITAWNGTAATSGLLWDAAIAAVALTVWILAEVGVRRNWSALLAIPATFLIGIGCGLPLYLFLRTRPL